MQCCFNFLWIFKYWKKYIYIFFSAISNIKKKCGVKKKKIREGVGVWIFFFFFFFRKPILSYFTFYAIFNIKKNNIEKCPFTYWLNGRWFLQIVEKKNPGGGGWIFFFFRKQILYFTFYAIFNIKKKYIGKVPLHLLVKWEVVSPNSREGQLGSISIILYSLDLILCLKCGGGFLFFFCAGNIVQCPFTYSYWLNGRWFLRIVDI